MDLSALFAAKMWKWPDGVASRRDQPEIEKKILPRINTDGRVLGIEEKKAMFDRRDELIATH